PQDLMQALQKALAERGLGRLDLFFEPGRAMVANAGALAMQVQYLKTGESKNFCIVDAAMNDMLRPALYHADMRIVPALLRDAPAGLWDVVGPICESGDWLGKDRRLAVEPGDYLVMLSSGAYGMSMAFNYNARGRAAEVMVEGDRHYLVRERETVADLLRQEKGLPS
ncbi:MAG: diaminopimelate decarboxylase, partial [Duodenibacillus sp.]|nr:diaminopimelate decarboxylase [Duodenibacillus sp.]